MDFTALLGRGVADHLALAERVIQQVFDQISGEASFDRGDATPAERVAAALGNRLTRLVLDEEATVARYEELVERNVVLASALGACDCWGDDVDCLICDGEGRPGWLPPDPQLYAIYVRPLTHRTNASPPPQQHQAQGERP